jgi:hypothetical protein
VRLGEALRRDPVHAGLDFAPPHVRGADRIGAAATNSRHLDRCSGITCRYGLTHALIRTIGVCAAGPAVNALRARADERVTPLRGVKDRVCQWFEPHSTALEASQHRNGGQPSGPRACLLVNPVLAREPVGVGPRRSGSRMSRIWCWGGHPAQTASCAGRRERQRDQPDPIARDTAVDRGVRNRPSHVGAHLETNQRGKWGVPQG